MKLKKTSYCSQEDQIKRTRNTALAHSQKCMFYTSWHLKLMNKNSEVSCGKVNIKSLQFPFLLVITKD